MMALPFRFAGIFVGTVLTLVASASVEQWPWTSICNKHYLPYNYTSRECLASSRSQLPVFNASAEYEVLFLSHPVEGVFGEHVSSLIGFTHTAIGFRQRNGHEKLTLEFFAINLGSEVIIPDILDGKFDWKDHGVTGWTPNVTSEWTDQILLGVTNGTVINEFMSWVPAWHSRHSSYELWSAWSDPELKNGLVRYFNETTCNTFVEDALWELYKLGAPLSSRNTLCRNYFVFITGSFNLVEPHGLLRSLRRYEMKAYYESLQTIRTKLNGSHVPVLRWLELAGAAIMEMLEPATYFYDGPSENYYFAKLKKPYVHIKPLYLNQRMVLPWQTSGDARLGECGPWANADILASDELVVV